MKMKKILASVAAAALAVSAMATTAFAADPVTVDFGDGYTGAWSQAGIIPKTEFDKFDGDVKVVLNLYATNVADGESYLLKPMEADKGWDPVTSQLTTAKETAKPDGFIMIHYDQTEVEFVVPSAMAKDMWDGGLSFQVNNVVIKSATLSDGEAEGAFNIVEDADTAAYCAKSVNASEDEDTEATEATETTEEAADTTEEATEATEATETAEATEAPVETTTEAPAETTAAPVEETTEAAPAETTAAPAQVGATNTATADKGNADTGIEGVAVVAGIAILAAGAVVIAKKRK